MRKKKASVIHSNHHCSRLPSSSPLFFGKSTGFPSAKVSDPSLARNCHVRFSSPRILNLEEGLVRLEKCLEIMSSSTGALLYFWLPISYLETSFDTNRPLSGYYTELFLNTVTCSTASRTRHMYWSYLELLLDWASIPTPRDNQKLIFCG